MEYKIEKLEIGGELAPKMAMLHPRAEEIYGIGDSSLLGDIRRVAIVGTRRPSIYGIKAAQLFAGHLAKKGVCVVSGLAIGIDSYAHQAVLDAGGTTIGVNPAGIEQQYPKSNRRLYKNIYKKGLIISENRSDINIMKHIFLKRNRIIAAISDAVIMVEGTNGSGAINTVHHALDLGTHVFAVPSSVFSVNSGTNYMISQGAELLYKTDQLDEFLGIGPAENYRMESIAALEYIREKGSATSGDICRLLDINITLAIPILDYLNSEGLIAMAEKNRYVYLDQGNIK